MGTEAKSGSQAQAQSENGREVQRPLCTMHEGQAAGYKALGGPRRRVVVVVAIVVVAVVVAAVVFLLGAALSRARRGPMVVLDWVHGVPPWPADAGLLLVAGWLHRPPPVALVPPAHGCGSAMLVPFRNCSLPAAHLRPPTHQFYDLLPDQPRTLAAYWFIFSSFFSILLSYLSYLFVTPNSSPAASAYYGRPRASRPSAFCPPSAAAAAHPLSPLCTPSPFDTLAQPKWNSVCFLFLLPFFFPANPSSCAGAPDPLLAPDPPHALTGVFLPLLSRRSPAPVYPGLKMVLVGLGAAGSAGNASASTFFLVLSDVDDATRDGIGDTPVLLAAAGLADDEDDDAHGVCPGFAPTRFDDAAGSAGNGLLDDAVDQLAFRLADERDDCAVELLSLSTRDPPCAAVPPLSASPVADPGSDG